MQKGNSSLGFGSGGAAGEKKDVLLMSQLSIFLLNKQNRESGTFCAPGGSLRASEMFSSVMAFQFQERFQQELCYRKSTLRVKNRACFSIFSENERIKGNSSKRVNMDTKRKCKNVI